ncbi:MAG: SDR family NAD(P)-dependent oxidoreductase [Spirochaetia bacterium]|nr:SDR family NAD(P)-dependent oxidoreductase [Spirochaetia bacterium]
MKNVFITGISSGLGEAFALNFLEKGYHVTGLSRKNPKWAYEKENLRFQSVNLGEISEIERNLTELFKGRNEFELVILNAAILGKISDMANISLDEIHNIMNVNVWANKIILDYLINSKIKVKQVVGISSGASVSGSRGWNAYSLSKSAFNMLIQLYAHEMPDTHLSALAPGLIDTNMQEYIFGLSKEEEKKYPIIKRLKEARGTAQMPKPIEAAELILSFLPKLLELESGKFYDIRNF